MGVARKNNLSNVIKGSPLSMGVERKNNLRNVIKGSPSSGELSPNGD